MNLPSISPPEEDIALRFKNAVPMASSLVSRSLPRANFNLLTSWEVCWHVIIFLALTSQTWSASHIHTWTETEIRQTETCVNFP